MGTLRSLDLRTFLASMLDRYGPVSSQMWPFQLSLSDIAFFLARANRVGFLTDVHERKLGRVEQVNTSAYQPGDTSETEQ